MFRIMRLFILCCLLPLSAASLAAPFIQKYNTFITINEYGQLAVKEDIIVQTDGTVVHHGLYRDIPNKAKLRSGRMRSVDIHVIKAEIDGHSSSYNMIENKYGYRIYLGDKDTKIAPGRHRFTIWYRTNSQIEPLRNEDVFYWNIIGPQWAFPIKHAYVSLQLPGKASQHLTKVSAYTGNIGSRTGDYTYKVQPNGHIDFWLKNPLAPHQAFTILMRWPAGFIKHASFFEKIKLTWRNYPNIRLLYHTMIGLFPYYLLCWLLFGRRPPMPPIKSQESPPNNLPPSACAYLLDMKYDPKLLAVAIMQLAVKKYLVIHHNGGNLYSLELVKEPDDQLEKIEYKLMQDIFRRNNTVDLSMRTRSMSQAAKNFTKAMEKMYRPGLFESHTFLKLAAIIVVSIISMACFINDMLLWTFSLVVCFSVYSALEVIRYIKLHQEPTIQCLLSMPLMMRQRAVVFGGALLLVFPYLFLFTGLRLTFDLYSLLMMFANTVIVVLHIVFFNRLTRPTVQGQVIRSRLKGFQLYLEQGSQSQASQRSEQQEITRFNQYLPYAYALGVEDGWENQFSASVYRSALSAWYHTSGYIGASGLMMAGFATGLTSAVSYASSSVGSGGFAGGGGGGGGGGGW